MAWRSATSACHRREKPSEEWACTAKRRTRSGKLHPQSQMMAQRRWQWKLHFQFTACASGVKFLYRVTPSRPASKKLSPTSTTAKSNFNGCSTQLLVSRSSQTAKLPFLDLEGVE